MLEKKGVRILISLLAAFALWAYVVMQVNPSTTKTIKGIPVNLTHTEILAERGLAVSSVGTDTIDVEVTGPIADLRHIDSDDVTASVDVTSAAKGENQLNITVRVPSGITVASRSTDRVLVNVEEYTTKEVPVTITYTGTFGENEEGTTVSVGTGSVTVSGAESLVSVVEYARGSIDASRLDDTENEISCQLQPVSKEGSTIPGVGLSQETVTVVSVISKVKAVKLEVPVEDYSSDDAIRTTEYPQEIHIAGRADLIKNITGVTADPVDITNLTENTEIELSFSELPEGVHVSTHSEKPVLTLTVEPMVERVFTFVADEIEFVGTSESLTYSIPDDFAVQVTARGPRAEVQTLTRQDIIVSLDVTGLTAGSSYAAVLIEVGGDTADTRFDNVSCIGDVDAVIVTVVRKNGSGG
ncbi:MAG: hypothetical protein IIZ42_00040 [Eubacterium sp.]|nr:hypothetical protein [Eubacterium sp.]